jgi:glycosyltransferase involved in cell wall biosynthesis
MISDTDIQVQSQKHDDGSAHLPYISIITVVYNSAKTIEQTIQSVIQQPYQNKEYIIIDGGSTDGTVEIIKKYSTYLSYWVSEHDNGIYDAMNKGIVYAKGDLIGIINSDDWYEKDILNTLAEHYKEFKCDHVIYGLLRIFKDEEFYSLVGNSIRVLHDDTIMHPTCFIPRKFYETYGNYSTEYKYSADYDLIIRFVNLGLKFFFIEKPIANFRLGGISSIPAAEKEMYRIRVKHHLISKTEYSLRLILVQITSIVKKFFVR